MSIWHLHKKTLAQFLAATLEYSFAIQNKIPLYLRATSPAPVHTLTPINPQILQLQRDDPSLDILKEHRLTGNWPNDLQPDHRQRLELLNPNLMINHNNVVWVQCQPECPKAPSRTAQYLLINYWSPVICQFQQ